ncbi:uncharacterized protein VTP21DRAFT_2255 [Calcarisporiella thermophila]|uniref:uncharacterized protein n=1 Tax=Calcarisporiella thermophila TaxID=911321 RepID=UPI00374400B4
MASSKKKCQHSWEMRLDNTLNNLLLRKANLDPSTRPNNTHLHRIPLNRTRAHPKALFLRALSRNDFEEAWSAYVKLADHNQLRTLTRRIYHHWIMVISGVKRCPEALQRLLCVVSDMKSLGMQLMVKEYNILIHLTGTVPRRESRWRLRDAQRVYEEMVREGVHPDIVTFNTLMTIAARSENSAAARRLWDEVLARGLRPNALTFTALMQAFAAEGNLDAVSRTYQEMTKYARIPPSIITMNVVIGACVRAGDFERAERILRELETGSELIRPNEITYQILAKGHLQAGSTQRALAFFRRIPRASLKDLKKCKESDARIHNVREQDKPGEVDMQKWKDWEDWKERGVQEEHREREKEGTELLEDHIKEEGKSR